MRQRVLGPERMDDPDLPLAEHERALRGLGRINRLSAAPGLLERRIRARLPHATERLRILDVACGGGDVASSLARRARTRGSPWSVEACDISAQALHVARRHAAQRGINVRFFQHDIVSAPLPDSYDVVVCSLFLHHLSEAEAVVVLRRLAEASRRLLLLSDLRRCRPGLWAARWTPRLLTRSRVVWEDAVLSVRAAFRAEELAALAAQAGMSGARIRRCWPWRMLLEWSA